MSEEQGGPAFPWCGDLNECPTINLGMTLRDWFAGQALIGVLGCFRDHAGDRTHEDRARTAYRYADAMLKARSAP